MRERRGAPPSVWIVAPQARWSMVRIGKAHRVVADGYDVVACPSAQRLIGGFFTRQVTREEMERYHIDACKHCIAIIRREK